MILGGYKISFQTKQETSKSQYLSRKILNFKKIITMVLSNFPLENISYLKLNFLLF